MDKIREQERDIESLCKIPKNFLLLTCCNFIASTSWSTNTEVTHILSWGDAE
jgi:hypothetical protein